MARIALERLEVSIVPHPFDFGPGEGSPVREHVLEAIHRMSACEPTAASDYRAAVGRLRAYRGEAMRLIRAAHDALTDDREFDRWSLIQLAAELIAPEALELFRRVLDAEVRPEEAVSCSGGRVAQRSLQQATALEGVRRLAAAGDRDALALLVASCRHGNRTVKRAAIQAYLALGGPDARATLLATLPASEHFWLYVRALGPGRVPWPSVPERDRRDRAVPSAPRIDDRR